MTLWWIGNAVLLLVVLPVVIYLLNGVLQAAKSIPPSVNRIATVGRRRLARTSTPPRSCSPRRIRSGRPSRASPNYGGSLDVILDDAEEQ